MRVEAPIASIGSAPYPHPQPPRARRTGTGVACLLLMGLTLGALGHVAVHLKSFEVAYDLGKERKARVELEEQRQRLKLEVGMLKDPGRVMMLARDKLGLAPPSPDEIVALGSLAPPRASVALTEKSNGTPGIKPAKKLNSTATKSNPKPDTKANTKANTAQGHR